MIKNKIANNAAWLIGCRIVQSLLALIINMFTARYLGPSNFGLISYAASIVAFVVPIMTLGISNVLVNEFVKSPEKEGEILGTTLTLTMVSAMACIVGVACFTMVANPNEPETLLVCVLYALSLLAQSLELVQYWFQSKYLAKYTSVVSVLAYMAVSLYKVFLLITAKSVRWFALSYALDYLLIAVALLVIYKKKGGKRLSFSWETAKHLVGQSRYYIVSSMMVTIFAQTDKIMLKTMCSTEDVGLYSAALTASGVAAFVFSAIIESMRPLIFESKKTDEKAFQNNVTNLYSIIIYLSLLQCVAITVLAKPLMLILFGQDYLPALPALRIIVWYSTFSYLGSVRNIWILAEQRQKFLWIINLSGALTNVVMNLILIPIIGISGAAAASLITQIFTNVIVGFIIKPIRGNKRLMIRSLNQRRCVAMVLALYKNFKK